MLEAMPNRSGAIDLVRIIAQRANTQVTFRPAQSGCAAPLARGQFCEVWITGDVENTESLLEFAGGPAVTLS